MAATASVLNILDIWLEPKALGWGINVRGRTVAAFVTFGAAESALTKVRAAVESRLSNNGARGDPMPPTFLPDKLMKICGLFVSTSHKTRSVRRLPSKITTGNYMPALFCLPDTWCTIQTTVTASRCQYVSLMAAAISLVLSFVVTWWILVGVAVGVFSAMWCGKVVREGWMYLGAVLLGMEILTTDFCGWGSAYPQVRLQALQHLNCDTGHASTTWLDYYLPNRDQMSPETSRSFGPGEVS